MSTKKTNPTRRRNQAAAESRSFGEQLRQWLHARQVAAGIRNRKRRKARPKFSRGVDRVPARYRVTRPEPQWVHRHQSLSRWWARRTGQSRGAVNQPYTNPMRDLKSLRSGRLRKELRP